MAVKSNHVTIKGIKDGLVFLLDDQCEFEDLLGELRFKLEHSHQNILTGPIIHVDIKQGGIITCTGDIYVLGALRG
ncbi:hypothetical protein C1I59_18670, partial [Paenibacillus polymyxa]